MATVVGADNQFLYIDDNTGHIKKVPISAFGFDQITGTVKQSQLATPTPTWINVKDVAYGAKGDTRIVDDGFIASATTVTSLKAKFTSADTGKTFYLTDEVYGLAFSGPGTITSVMNSTTIVCTNLDNTRVGQTFNLTWGTDDTAALKAAWTAAEASPSGTTIALNQNGMRTVYIPAGGYMFSSRPFHTTVSPGVSLIGDGPRKTVFYPHPSFDFTSVNANEGMLWQTGSSDVVFEIANFSIFGTYLSFSGAGAANKYLMNIGGTNFHDVVVEFLGGSGATGVVGGFYGSVNGVVKNVQAISVITTGAPSMTINGGAGVMSNCFTSNSTQGLTVSGMNYSAFSGSFLLMLGCFSDECGLTPTKFINSNGVVCIGCQFYTASNALGGRAVEVDGTSIVRFEGCTFGPYSYSFLSSGGLTVDTGGIVYASDSDFRSNAGGKAITNNGTIYDGLGNSVDAGGINGSGTISQKTIAMPV